jgi:hypothetical protein
MRGCINYPDRIVAIYPGSYLHFRKVLGNPRWEDFDYELLDEENPFSFFGNGMTEMDMNMQGNFAPYMNIEEEYPELKEYFVNGKDGNGGKVNGVNGNGVPESDQAKVSV